MAQLILMPGKERSAFKQRHPWVFAGSVGRLEGRARPGDTVEVLADNLRPLGRAAYSPKSQIRARFWTFDPDESVDDAFFKRRIAAAVARRQALARIARPAGVAPDPRRIGRLAGRHRRPLRRHRRRPADLGRRRQVAQRHRRRSAQGDRLRAHLRAFRFRRARAGRAGADDRLAAWRGTGLAAGHRGKWRASRGQHRRRPQDRLLPRPARQPRPARPTGGGQGGAQLLLLHRRLFAAGAGRRGGARAFDRLLRSGAGAGAGESGTQSAVAGRARRMARGRCLPGAARFPQGWPAVRPDRPRSAQSSRPPPPMPSARRAPTRTSTCLASACSSRAGC